MSWLLIVLISITDASGGPTGADIQRSVSSSIDAITRQREINAINAANNVNQAESQAAGQSAGTVNSGQAAPEVDGVNGSVNQNSIQLQEISELTNSMNDEMGGENKQEGDDEAGAENPIAAIISFFMGRSSENFGQGDMDEVGRFLSSNVDFATINPGQFNENNALDGNGKRPLTYKRSDKNRKNISDLKAKGYFYDPESGKIQTPNGKFALSSYNTLDGMINVHGLTRSQALKILANDKKKIAKFNKSKAGKRLAFLKKQVSERLAGKKTSGSGHKFNGSSKVSEFEPLSEKPEKKLSADDRLDALLASLGGKAANNMGGVVTAFESKFKLYNGTRIGIQTDNIFNIVIRAYNRKKHTRGYFLSPK